MTRQRKCKAPKPIQAQAVKAARRKIKKRAPMVADWLSEERSRQYEHLRLIADDC